MTDQNQLLREALQTIKDLTHDRLFTAEWASKHGATLAKLEAALANPAEGGEAAHIEVVGKVVEREDGNEVLWSIEGGIEAIPAGMVLLISDRPVTDDNGQGEVYTTPPASQEQAKCVACEGNPAPGNNPCAVCGSSQAQQPSPQAWANETGLRQIECPSCGDLAVAYDPQQPSGEVAEPTKAELIAQARDLIEAQEHAHATGYRIGFAAATERKGEPVDMGAWLWSKLADYCRRKGLNPHHENDLFNLAGELRAMLAHTSPQVPEDVQRDAERYRWLRENGRIGFSGAPHWNVSVSFYSVDSDLQTLDRNIDAARKGEKA